MEHLVSLVNALAWPVAVTVLIVLFRPQIRELIKRVQEFKGGGFAAKFQAVAEDSVDIVSESMEPAIEDMDMVTKGGARELHSQIAHLDESKPIVLTLVIGRGYYNQEALVVVDEEGRSRGVVEREQVLSRLLLSMTK